MLQVKFDDYNRFADTIGNEGFSAMDSAFWDPVLANVRFELKDYTYDFIWGPQWTE